MAAVNLSSSSPPVNLKLNQETPFAPPNKVSATAMQALAEQLKSEKAVVPPAFSDQGALASSTKTVKLVPAFKVDEALLKAFGSVKSNKPIPLKGVLGRKEFWALFNDKKWDLNPVVISRSPFVPSSVAEHLLRNKKNSALSVKFEGGDKITNMEGALHTFVIPICPITMVGDHLYQGKHGIKRLTDQGRQVILSAAIHPDFELPDSDEIVMRIVEVTDEPLAGKALPENFQPLWNLINDDRAAFQAGRRLYNQQLREHMVFHLTAQHRLPALKELKPNQILETGKAMAELEKILLQPNVDIAAALQNVFVRLKDHVISLEALFNLYVQQIRNEFAALETLLPQGYVYTIDPPSIFASQIGGVANVGILNRLQMLAFKHLKAEIDFKNLKVIGFNDYRDQGAVKLYQAIFPEKLVVPKTALFKDGSYSITNDYALVIHNNSDAFGQNIETESASSMDGVIGSYSDASCQLMRQRPDLMTYS